MLGLDHLGLYVRDDLLRFPRKADLGKDDSANPILFDHSIVQCPAQSAAGSLPSQHPPESRIDPLQPTDDQSHTIRVSAKAGRREEALYIMRLTRCLNVIFFR